MTAHEQTLRAVLRYQAGDESAMAEIVRLNMGLIRKAIGRVVGHKRRDDHDEFMAVAYDGLLRAVRRFDVTLGYRFSTYAYRSVEFAVSGQWRAEGKARRRVIIMDPRPNLRGRGNGRNVDNPFVAAAAPGIPGLDRAVTADGVERIRRAMGRLSEREGRVIELRMEGRTLPEIGRAMGGLSRQRVAQLQDRALAALIAAVGDEETETLAEKKRRHVSVARRAFGCRRTAAAAVAVA